MITVRDMSKNDEIETPIEALIPLLPYLPKDQAIWEMCPGSGVMVQHFMDAEYTVGYIGKDSLEYEPPWQWDIIVTNPPWSKKHLFLERCIKLGKPFALLLPVRTLGVRRCQKWLTHMDVLFLKRRVDFTGGGAPYEACAWFSRYLLPDRMVFET